jgi:hypothetical protein
VNFYYSGGMREDTLGKVYRVDWSGTEKLIYDFTLQLNDTFVYNLFSSGIDMIVDSVGVYSAGNGDMRKWMHLSSNNPGCEDTWIAGIGSLQGIDNSFGVCMTADLYLNLNCFFEHDTMKFDDPNYPGCYYTSVGIKETELSKVKIWPNPMSDQTTFYLPEESKDAELFLIDSFGRIVKSIHIGSVEKFILHREELSAGIYSYRLKENSRTYSGKLVIR